MGEDCRYIACKARIVDELAYKFAELLAYPDVPSVAVALEEVLGIVLEQFEACLATAVPPNG